MTTTPNMTIDDVNRLGRAAFVDAFGGTFEHSPWVAERAHKAAPFASRDALHAAMVAAVDAATDDEKLALIRAHPDLVGRLAREGRLTADSTAEQRAAGLDALAPGEAADFERFNAAYRERFGFPFVICARENRKAAILAAFPVRLRNDAATEVRTALAEVAKIARLRLADRVDE